MAMGQQGSGMWDYYDQQEPVHQHFPVNGVLVTAEECDDPDCSIRVIHEGSHYCGTCNNTRVIYVPCGCPPDPSMSAITAYAQGSASGGPSHNNGRNSGSGGGGGSSRVRLSI
ncbi:hypothetical protein MAPG_05513 [Magnaporthiopsis poae ATCC 64411]|uniref:Uncharacterized protein n=1 Tax=Magnaporthiopsis poae (strain ATCC 64411 / 73-15) TaxID=644358 RepID=A0A0C4DZK9_MAGP6|nr:hypothetical protein MAPG_05513 [Magnaporthiopsis poae ATCC 64411]